MLVMWFSLSKSVGNVDRPCKLLGSPYILFFGFSVAMVVLGSLNEATVSRSRYLFYCTINLSVVYAVELSLPSP
jgi:hypothetical protein